jgi:hypothetical protein
MGIFLKHVLWITVILFGAMRSALAEECESIEAADFRGRALENQEVSSYSRPPQRLPLFLSEGRLLLNGSGPGNPLFQLCDSQFARRRARGG